MKRTKNLHLMLFWIFFKEIDLHNQKESTFWGSENMIFGPSKIRFLIQWVKNNDHCLFSFFC